MTGKNKCKILKEIRRQIAEKNDIELVIEECKHKGDCLGTCPRCEAEVRYLERELERRRALGKSVAVAGLVATLTASSTGCALVDNIKNNTSSGIFPTKQTAELEGDIAYTYELDGSISYNPETYAETEEPTLQGKFYPETETEETQETEKAEETDTPLTLGGSEATR